MTIIVFDNAYWNIINFRLDFIYSLVSKNYNIIAIAPNSKSDEKILKSLGVKCIPINFNVNGINPFLDLVLCFKLFSLFLKFRHIDFVLTYTIKPNIYGTIVGKLFNLKIINNISGLGSVFINTGFITKLVIKIYKFIFRITDWIFFQNQSDVEFFKNKKLLHSNYSVIPGSGLNFNKFNFNRVKNSGKKILFVGRIMGEKGVRELIFAAQKLSLEYKDLSFYFIGEIGYKNVSSISSFEIDNWIKNNSNFKFLGKVSDVKPFYENCDIMVLPSYREGLSKSLVEASAMCMPIITTDVPGCSDVIVNNMSGLLVEPYDFMDLYNKIKIMIEMDEEERIKMGVFGRNFVMENFDVHLVIDSYLNVFEKLK